LLDNGQWQFPILEGAFLLLARNMKLITEKTMYNFEITQRRLAQDLKTAVT
jgi:hypothetical protein